MHIHFTVSPAHQAGFEKILGETVAKYEERFDCRYDISFSVQDPSTDIIAVNEDNTPFLKEDGQPLYRPGGHGALLRNLAAVDGDIIFLKNIDNVVHQRLLDDTVRWKKVLAGKLLEVRQKIWDYLIDLDVMMQERKDNPALLDESCLKCRPRFTRAISMPSSTDRYVSAVWSRMRASREAARISSMMRTAPLPCRF